jgi:ubiquinone/menaquinone biosynthesis C-methylase UbiE
MEATMTGQYGGAAAGGYDQAFGQVSRDFVPTLLRVARLARGMRVLDIATGTGAAAEGAVATVGPAGHVVAADLSPAMLDKARGRLDGLPNLAFAVEDGQHLSFPDGSFDAVLCQMSLMLFDNPARGLSEFRRVLREGGWAAVSVNTVPGRSFHTRVNDAIARRVPARAAAAGRFFSLGDADRLRALFEAAGFRDVGATAEARRYPFPSFDTYFEPIERGWGQAGQEYLALPAEMRRAVREDVRRGLEGDAGAGGPVEVEVELLFVGGRR